jgi:hypothetical protein
MNALLLALLAVAATRQGQDQHKGPFLLKAGRTYRMRVLVHRCSVPITKALVDAAREQAARVGIRDIKLSIVDGKTLVDATVTPPADVQLPAGRVQIEQGPLSAEVEYIFVRELGPPGV